MFLQRLMDLRSLLKAFSFPHFQRSYVFTFLLSSRLFLHPYELMTRVCHLCVEQQRSGDALLDKVGGLHTHTQAHTRAGVIISYTVTLTCAHTSSLPLSNLQTHDKNRGELTEAGKTNISRKTVSNYILDYCRDKQ